MSAPLQGLEAWGSRCATGVQEIPQRLIVVGGVVACEAATWMSSLGNDVTMLVRGPASCRLRSPSPPDSSRRLSPPVASSSSRMPRWLPPSGLRPVTPGSVASTAAPSRSPAPVEPSRLMRSWSPLAVALPS